MDGTGDVTNRTDSGVGHHESDMDASTEIIDASCSRPRSNEGDHDEEEEEEEPEREPPTSLAAALVQINFLSQAKSGLERTLLVRNEEIQRLRAQVREASQRSVGFNLPENPLLPTTIPTAGQQHQALLSEICALKAELDELKPRFSQAQDVMFQCSQAEDEAKERTVALERANSLLNEEAAAVRQRCSDMSAKCQSLHVECNDLRARLREMEETCARSIEEQVATRCSKRLSDIREQHTVDMLRLEKKKEELHMLVDQQNDTIGALQKRLDCIDQRSSPGDSESRSRSNTSPSSLESRSVEAIAEEPLMTASIAVSPSGKSEDRSMLTQSLPQGLLGIRSRSLPASSTRGFTFRRSKSDTAEQPSSLRSKFQVLTEKLNNITAKDSPVPEQRILKPPPAISGIAQVPRSIDRPWTPHDGELTALQFSPSGSYLATGGSDCLVKLWVEGTREFNFHRQLVGCTKGIVQVDFDREESSILAASNDQSVQVWRLSTASSGKREVFNHVARIATAKFLNGDASKVVSSCFDRNLRIWDVTSRICGTTQAIKSTCVDLVSSTTDFSIPIITAHTNGQLNVWDVRLKPMSDGMEFPGCKMNSIALSPDQHYVACLMDQREIQVIDVRRKKTVHTLSANGFSTKPTTRVVYSGDGEYIACGGSTLFVWSTKTGELVKSVEMGKSTMFSCAWYPSGSSFLTAHANGASIWKC